MGEPKAPALLADLAHGHGHGHWTVENQLHWVRDVTYDEDCHRARTGNAPQAMAGLRELAFTILRLPTPPTLSGRYATGPTDRTTTPHNHKPKLLTNNLASTLGTGRLGSNTKLRENGIWQRSS